MTASSPFSKNIYKELFSSVFLAAEMSSVQLVPVEAMTGGVKQASQAGAAFDTSARPTHVQSGRRAGSSQAGRRSTF